MTRLDLVQNVIVDLELADAQHADSTCRRTYNGHVEAHTMTLAIAPDPAPVAVDADGVARVGGTRVTLDIVIRAFKLGGSPDDIARSYDSLSLADVYGAIAYYLRHTAEVDDYLSRRHLEADELRRLNEARIDRQAIRERLLERAAKLRSP